MAVEKRKDSGTWRVRWFTIAGEPRSRACPNRRTALEVDAEIREAHSRGRDWEPAPSVDEPTIADLCTAYQERRRLVKRANTMRVEGMHLGLFLRFVYGRSKATPTAGLLTRALLDEFLGWLLRPETGRHERARKPSSAGKVVQAAQRLWSWAEESERWPGQIPRPRSVEIPKAVRSEVLAPTWAEMDACVAACNGWQRQLATWLRYTGLRAGESMLLLWSDVDMKKGTVAIRPEISKTGIGRTIPISPLVIDEIATWGKREGYLIPTKRHRDAKFHRDPRARDIRRAWKRAGVREEVWTQRPEHAFRRGFKTGLLALGCHPDAVDFLQGHALGGSRGRYIDANMLPLRETIARVPEIGKAEGNVVKLRSGGKR